MTHLLPNLPHFITLHALGLGALGLYQTFHISHRSPSNPLLGIATLALSLAYLFTAYMPIEQNQFLYATVPVRMILAAVAAIRLLIGGGLGKEERRNLLVVALYDGGGAMVLGWWLGSFDGRCPKLGGAV